MKNSALVILAAIAMVAATESFLTEQAADRQKTRYEVQVERYEQLLDVQEQKYIDELIEVRQELAKTKLELRAKQFDFDMATNRVEQLNKEIGVIQ